MNILMIGNVASVGYNLVKGLRNSNINVIFVGNKSNIISGEYDFSMSWHDFLQKKYGKKHFDIIHIHSPNLKKLGISWRYLTEYLLYFRDNTKLICHWHGSDLRIPKKAFPVYYLLKKIADFNLYSTIDLGWWLKNISNNKKMHFRNPVDTEIFKTNNSNKTGILISGKGAISKNEFIKHKNMPELLNKYKIVKVYPSDNLNPNLISVFALESASCGCKLFFHPDIDRKWIIENASVESQTKKLIEVYNEIL